MKHSPFRTSQQQKQSSLARGKWIEAFLFAQLILKLGESSLARGKWIEAYYFSRALRCDVSSLARGKWIEAFSPYTTSFPGSSSLARGKWIEAGLVRQKLFRTSLPSQEGSGLKHRLSLNLALAIGSSLARGKWIEAFQELVRYVDSLRLPSQEGSGLKLLKHIVKLSCTASSLARGKWIEAPVYPDTETVPVPVFPRKREVD